MNEKTLKDLLDIAEEFGNIAKKVNDSSQKRKIHSEEAMKFLNQCLEIGEILNKDVETIANTNKELSNQNNAVLNSCLILHSNMKNQSQILKNLKKTRVLDNKIIDELNSYIENLQESLDKSLDTIKEVIAIDNNIILMDKLIITRKQYQRENIYQLKELTLRSLEDAENAIKGSSSNLSRGLEMVDKFKNVKHMIENNEIDKLKSLSEEASTGSNIAQKVNKSSSSQLEFAERVNQFTEQLHSDTLAIKDLVINKHESFKNNLENITIITVILSLEFKSYFGIKEYVNNIILSENLPPDSREDLLNFIAFTNIASGNIDYLANLNYDMTESIHLNADLESKSLELTNIELDHYNSIKKEVNSMTDATRYPIEGSSLNIKNGSRLEELLTKLINEI